MYFFLVIPICLAFFPSPPVPWGPDSFGAIVTFGATLALYSLLHFVRVRRLCRRPATSRQQRAYDRWRRWNLLFLLLAEVTVLWLGGWSAAVRYLWVPRDPILLDDILLLVPLTAFCCGWGALAYDAELYLGRLDAEPFGRVKYVLTQCRQSLGLIALPILALQGVFDTALALSPTLAASPIGSSLLLAACTIVIVWMLPWLLRWLWGARPLPPGQTRQLLESVAARLRFRYSDFLLWPTGGRIANALVTGVFPRPRYILLSDRLLDQLTPQEIASVLGHEIGHIRHQHLLTYLGFFGLTGSVVALLGPQLSEPLWHTRSWHWDHLASWSVWGLSLVLFAMLVLYLWAVFGYLSRRCENQADLFGCRVVSCARWDCAAHDRALGPNAPLPAQACPTGVAIFSSALTKVAEINGMPLDRRGWQHDSVAGRVAFLEHITRTPAGEQRFHSRLLRLKCLLLLATALVGFLAWRVGQWLH
ncbi:MAG: hypothetical protein C4297_11625 [Gemmataceae bacterium]